MDERHPDARAEARRLDHQPRVAGSGRERLELAQDAARSPAQRDARTSSQSTTGSPIPRVEPLEDRLVHADRRRGDTRAGVGEAGRLEQRLDRAVLAERPVERDEHDRSRFGARSRSSAAPTVSGPSRRARADRRRPPVRGRSRRWSAGSHHQRPSRSIRTCSTSWPLDASASAIAVPDTIDTSCSADGPPSRTTIGTGDRSRRRSAQSPRNSTSGSSRTPNCRLDRVAGAFAGRPDVGRGALPVVDDEVRVLLGDRRAADPVRPLSPAESIRRPAESPGGLRNASRPTGSRAAGAPGASRGSRRGGRRSWPRRPARGGTSRSGRCRRRRLNRLSR